MVHVPAWKRVGLKLKRHSESEATASVDLSKHIPKKIKLNGSANAGADRHLGKTNGISPPVKNGASRKASAKFHETPAASSGRPPLHSIVTSRPLDTGLKKRKSVTFSPDAKSKDGPEQALDYSEINGEATDGPESPIKKQKTRKGSDAQGPEPAVAQLRGHDTGACDEELPSGDSTKPYLTYLNEYHNHRAGWRFNKNRQTQVLHNVFNVYRIPVSYGPVLGSYLSGLRGDSRTRLREDARRVLAETQAHEASANGEPAEQINGDANAAAETETASVIKQERARMIIAALAQDDGTPPKLRSADPETLSAAKRPPPKRSRGRKRRSMNDSTDDIYADSSSSSESSESEEEAF